MTKRPILIAGALLAAVTVALFALWPGSERIDEQLRAKIADQNIEALELTATEDPAQIELGRMLFWDPELSGNRNISCGTCHHPLFASGDGLSTSIGQGGTGVGADRHTLDGGAGPRNANDIFNRGSVLWVKMFWDARVEANDDGTFSSPAGRDLPDGLDDVLAAQAMFPVEAQGEMRGNAEDVDIFGVVNELAALGDDDFVPVWDALMARVLAIAEYVTLFSVAFPDVPTSDLGFEHAANAIAAYERFSFVAVDNPWHAYVGGTSNAISDQAKRGALLFFGEAGCAACHSGPLLTDQAVHSLAVPQVGPGKEEEGPEDWGAGRVTGAESDQYHFRTPSLLNVSATKPWMHDGAFTALEAVIQHHIDPEASLMSYDVTQTVGPGLLFLNRDRYIEPLLASISPELSIVPALTSDQIADLVAFLETLTDPSIHDRVGVIPTRVPSGLPIDR